jgi:hypothetical protein
MFFISIVVGPFFVWIEAKIVTSLLAVWTNLLGSCNLSGEIGESPGEGSSSQWHACCIQNRLLHGQASWGLVEGSTLCLNAWKLPLQSWVVVGRLNKVKSPACWLWECYLWENIWHWCCCWNLCIVVFCVCCMGFHGDFHVRMLYLAYFDYSCCPVIACSSEEREKFRCKNENVYWTMIYHSIPFFAQISSVCCFPINSSEFVTNDTWQAFTLTFAGFGQKMSADIRIRRTSNKIR